MAFDRYTGQQRLDRRAVMESYFPDFLQGNTEFRVFIKVASKELGLASDYIELFTDLANVDKTPEQFVKDLGDMVGYSFIEEVDPDVQREIIKRIFNKHEARGDKDSIEMMATHASNPGYIGGDIFLPGTYRIADRAVVTFPRDKLFTWSHSKRNGFDKYPDGNGSMDGVMEVVISYYDKNISNRVNTVKPAGVKLSFKMSVIISDDGDLLKIRLPVLYTDVALFIDSYVNARRISYRSDNCYSGRSSLIRRSGRRYLTFSICPEYHIFVKSKDYTGSIIKDYYSTVIEALSEFTAIPVQIIKQWKGPARYSMDFIWSGKRARSGLRTDLFEVEVPHRHYTNMDNSYIFIEEMSDNLISGFYGPEPHLTDVSVEVLQSKEE